MDDAGPPCVTDPDRVRQIVLNLLSNAIKFADRGAWTVSAVPVATRRAAWWWRCACATRAPAFAPEDLERIFLEFEQVSGHARRHGAGAAHLPPPGGAAGRPPGGRVAPGRGEHLSPGASPHPSRRARCRQRRPAHPARRAAKLIPVPGRGRVASGPGWMGTERGTGDRAVGPMSCAGHVDEQSRCTGESPGAQERIESPLENREVRASRTALHGQSRCTGNAPPGGIGAGERDPNPCVVGVGSPHPTRSLRGEGPGRGAPPRARSIHPRSPIPANLRSLDPRSPIPRFPIHVRPPIPRSAFPCRRCRPSKPRT